MADLENLKVAKVVDARGSACPGPLLEAKKAMGVVSVGDVVEILSGDSSTKADLPRWAAKVGHEYLGALEDEGFDRIFITRGK
jgi:tRNA 2-thiouridine synthesizing protein A